MNTISRREFVVSSAAGLVAIGTFHSSAPDAEETSMDIVQAFTTNYALKPLPFDPAKLPGLSERLLRSHWENNYGGAVKALNAIKARLAQALADPDLPPFIYNDLKREHLLRTGSVVLHELYFDNLGGDGTIDTAMRTLIAARFGNFDAWEREFRRIGLGLGGGSGWVVLGYNRHLDLLENYWMSDHMHGAVTTAPLLVMDMYEHAYHIDYGAAASSYIDAFFKNIRWTAVATRWANSGHQVST